MGLLGTWAAMPFSCSHIMPDPLSTLPSSHPHQAHTSPRAGHCVFTHYLRSAVLLETDKALKPAQSLTPKPRVSSPHQAKYIPINVILIEFKIFSHPELHLPLQRSPQLPFLSPPNP